MRREALKERLLAVIEQEVFSPDAIAYLTKRANEALTRVGARDASKRRALEAELRTASEELENIKTPIRRGVVTDTTKQILEEEAEREVQRIRALPRPVGQMTLRLEGDGIAEVRGNVDV